MTSTESRATRPATSSEVKADTASKAYLLARLDLLRTQIEVVVARRRAEDPRPDDPYRGVYLEDGDVDLLLAERGLLSRRPDPDPQIARARAALDDQATRLIGSGENIGLLDLASQFDLDPLDLDLLLVAIAPDLDPAFEKLYGYLNDDVTRRRASVGLALELLETSPTDGWARSRLSPDGPLFTGRLALLEDDDRPLLTRSVRIPDRVVAHLLGRDEPDSLIAPLLITPARWPASPRPEYARAIAAGVTLIYLREGAGGAAISDAAAGLAAAGRGSVVIDLGLLSGRDDVDALVAVAAREARLLDAALVVSHVESISERGPAEVRRWAEAPGVVALTGTLSWDPRWSRRPALMLDAPRLNDHERATSWAGAIGAEPEAGEPWRSVGAYQLTPEQVGLAATAAIQRAAARGGRVAAEDLQAGARSQNAAGLEKLACRISPRATWEDLVLPPAVEGQLLAIAGRVRYRGQVLDEWDLASRASRGRGVTVLFAGDSGTGKTMSAEVVAGSLGLDMYVIDLSSVVDKYIGETEKNLDRIFVEAERVNGVLLFDEADAIFGKRSEVRDARDRYANVEVAYLLQRMEQFEGVAILTTNLRANVDEAFLRRIDVLVEFPVPDQQSRAHLWRKHLAAQLPLTDDVDIGFLATAFELSGGNIRNIVLAAAFEAAEAGLPVSMTHLIHATSGEYRKLGRLCVEAEFGPYFAELRSKTS